MCETLKKARDHSALVFFSFQPFNSHWIFCICCGRNPTTPVMSCKAKKNKQEKFHLAFICCQNQTVPYLKHSYTTAGMLMSQGFSHNTRGHHHHLCPQAGFTLLSALPTPGFFLLPSKEKSSLHKHFASRASNKGSKTASVCWRLAATVQGVNPPYLSESCPGYWRA